MKAAQAPAETVAAEEVKATEPPVRETLVLDLAPCAGGGISHGGNFYLSRVAYKVTPQEAADLLEAQNRGWAHEASLKENENRNRRRQNSYLRGAA